MTEPQQPESGTSTPPVDAPPTTGLAEVDAAVLRLAELAERPLAEHPELIARAHEVLHGRLSDRGDASEPGA